MQMNVSGTYDMNIKMLLCALYKKKWHIILSTLLGFSVGLAYLFLTPPIYEAQAKVAPVTDAVLNTFNQVIPQEKSAAEKKNEYLVYTAFRDIILLKGLKDDFFNQVYFPALSAEQQKFKEQEYALFFKNLVITEYPTLPLRQFTKYTIAFRSPSVEQAGKVVEQFMDFARIKAIAMLNKYVKEQKEAVIFDVQKKIQFAREAAKMQRTDRVAQLEEAIHIAQLAEITTSSVDAKLSDNTLYLLGPKILQAEIKGLLERKSDDPFIPGLRKLQMRFAYYNAFALDLKNAAVFRQDGQIATSHTPVFPKKLRVMMFGLVLGFLMGILMVLLPIAWRKGLAESR